MFADACNGPASEDAEPFCFMRTARRKMGDLKKTREEIDEIDRQLVQLFKRRMHLAGDALKAKLGAGLPVLDPAREREIMARVAREAGPEMENEARIVFSTLFSLSRAKQNSELHGGGFAAELEKSMKQGFALPSSATVACPGVEGGYSQQAACRMVKFPSIFYFKSFEDVFAAVEGGMCDCGVLPVENSKAGSVTGVYDLMAHHSFRIVKAVKLRIRHALLGVGGASIDGIEEVVSHPHALAQCTGLFAAHPGFRSLPASNTAVAAKELAASGRKDVAVIASRECAALYGLKVLAEDVSDVRSNFTRFICISKSQGISPSAGKISLMMSLGHRPGALADVLMRFAAADINLTKLESRPVEGSDFEFRFIFELEASLGDGRTAALLDGLACDPDIEHFTFLGAYEE